MQLAGKILTQVDRYYVPAFLGQYYGSSTTKLQGLLRASKRNQVTYASSNNDQISDMKKGYLYRMSDSQYIEAQAVAGTLKALHWMSVATLRESWAAPFIADLMFQGVTVLSQVIASVGDLRARAPAVQAKINDVRISQGAAVWILWVTSTNDATMTMSKAGMLSAKRTTMFLYAPGAMYACITVCAAVHITVPSLYSQGFRS